MIRLPFILPAPLFLHGLAQRLGAFERRQPAPRIVRTRVVRISGQLLLQAGGQFVQSVRVLFHGNIVTQTRGPCHAIVFGGVA